MRQVVEVERTNRSAMARRVMRAAAMSHSFLDNKSANTLRGVRRVRREKRKKNGWEGREVDLTSPECFRALCDAIEDTSCAEDVRGYTGPEPAGKSCLSVVVAPD